MIKSFRHSGLQKLFKQGERKKLRPEHVNKIRRILARLNEAEDAKDMDLPGYRLHALKGKLSVLIFYYFKECFMAMFDPPHPGESIRVDCLEPLGLSITEGARILGVTRQALNNIVNGKSGISPEMAIRLSKAFGGGAEVWLRLQISYDLAQAMKHQSKLKVKRVSRDRVKIEGDLAA
jgi:addiction module HigA family antidote